MSLYRFTISRMQVAGLIITLAVLLLGGHHAHAAATITVNSTKDKLNVADLAGNGTCDIREAVEAANLNTTVGECEHNGSAGLDTIVFNIPGAPTYDINLANSLYVTAPVVIDGTSEPDYTGGKPVIRLDGEDTVWAAIKLSKGSDGSTLRGLMIVSFITEGIWAEYSGGHTIQLNYIGTNGDKVLGTGAYGIELTGSSNNQIGGADKGNVIAGAWNSAIRLFEKSSDNKIQGNTIGVDAAGAPMPNGQSGVYLQDAPDTIIGGFSPGEGNIIGGNKWSGVMVEGNKLSFDVVIAGNRVGVNAAGEAVPNQGYGIYLFGDVDAQVSTNWVAYHDSTGIYVDTASGAITTYGSQRNCITYNKVGATATGGSTNLERNYWGASDGPSPFGSGDAIVGSVIYNPWLTGSPNFLGYPDLVCPGVR
jgi:hypothetical protein